MSVSKSPQTGGRETPSTAASLVVFAKHWTPGQTKTRLAADIGAAPAATLSRAFLSATLANIDGVADNQRLLYTPAELGAEFETLGAANAPGWAVAPQPAGDLGARMHKVLNDADTPTMLIGSDSPDLPRQALRDALDWLSASHGRFALGPSDDGGYWAVGCHGDPPPEVFDDMPWGSPEVYAETIDRLERAGQRPGVDYLVLPQWYDVDTAADLRALYVRLSQRAEDAAWLADLRSAIEPYCG